MDQSDQETHESWRTVFARLGPRLVLFARQWLANPMDAEDAVQEGFVRFWRREGKLNQGNQGLLFAAVRSAALDLLRKEGRRQRREHTVYQEDAVSGTEAPFFDPAETADGTRQLELAMHDLPAEQREVLVLRIWGELTFAEVAVALAILPNTAASRYRYALAALKKTLQPA